jgi:hypothetical protein
VSTETKLEDAQAAGAAAPLRAAWDDMIAALARAREAIDDPTLYPPPPSERNLAEGYRYLLGFVFGAVERALSDPRFPAFRRALQPTDKATIDNADALYLCTPVDADCTYRITGRARDCAQWRLSPQETAGLRSAASPSHASGQSRSDALERTAAPRYVIFEATTAYAGDSGTLAELSPAVRTNTGTLDSSKLAVEPDGSFEIVVAPVRPDGWMGNFIPTRRKEHRASYLVVRELFGDWDREEALELRIACEDAKGSQPPPLDARAAARAMRTIGEIVNNQMRFWNEFYAVLLETYGDTNGDGKRFMPRNDLNAPSFASIATGGGQTTNLYAGGVFELGPDDALIVELRTPVAAAYQGFHLSNLWGESLDYANHQTSLNAVQAEADGDGVVRFVVAHRDPGVPNWLDTTGLSEGFLTARWTYPTKPAELPAAVVTKTAFSELRSLLPAATRTVSADQRRAAIAARQAHVQRRYRQY